MTQKVSIRIHRAQLTLLIAILLINIVLGSCSRSEDLIQNLTVEYTNEPLGIDVETPRFAWQMHAPGGERGYYQTAYQIEVVDQSGELVWDSGGVEDQKALAIPYEGSALQASTRYNWTVAVWDQNGKKHQASSWFETGLMNPEIEAWGGADWIGGGDDDLVFFAPYDEVFDLKYSVAIEKGSTKAAFVYGANDSRLMDRYKNIYQLENAKDQSYIKLELDLSDMDKSANGLAKFNIYRVGYAPGDLADKPFKTFTIKKSVVNNANKNEKHAFDVKSFFGKIYVSLDGEKDFYVKDNKPAEFVPPFRMNPGGAAINLNPIGEGGDYLAFGMVCQIGFAIEPGQHARFSDLEIRNIRKPANIIFTEDLNGEYAGIFANKLEVKDGAYVLNGADNGNFIVADPSRNSAPMLRTEFDTDKAIQSARLYVTSRGIYEVYFNGEKVGYDYYNPGQTQYNKSHFYQTYDVTNMLHEGKNAFGAMLSEGWWSGLLSFGTVWNHFGDRQSLLAKLVITYEDGSEKVVVTNDKDWTFTNSGPIIYSSLDMGEVYDANCEEKFDGWKNTGFDDSDWKTASVVPVARTTYSGEDRDFDGTVTDFNYDDMKLIGQIGNNAGVYTTLTAQNMQEVRPGVYVYDMGQNFVGVPHLSFASGTKGDTVTLRYAEILYPDLKASGDNVGMIMTENYRAALCQDLYIMKDGPQVFQPKFTSRGYQYIEITGIDEPLPLEAVQGVAISSILELAADYKTSNPKVNQLWSNLTWSNIDNFLTLPTDCPQRNERMGWSGDISVFSRTATYLSNSDQFLRRHMFAMRDVQKSSGKFTDVAPVGGGFGGLLWGSAGLTVAWETYLQYDDKALLKEHYDAMVAYIDYLDKSIDPETGMCRDVQLGDWLGPQNNKLGAQYLATAYHVFDLQIIKETAKILGKDTDYNRFEAMYNERKDFFNQTFLNEDHKTLGYISAGYFLGPQGGAKPEFKLADTQTSYAVGLALDAFADDLIPDMAANLAETIARQNEDDGGVLLPEYSLMTGFIGTAWVSKALSDYGYNDEAYRLLQSEQYPSWLYSIDQGAKTIWERLNGYTVEHGFGGNNSMNSFNHYSFGAVGQWMIAYSLGIQRDEPGFRKFILQPTPDPSGQMTSAEGYYDSMYGKIYSKWEVKDGQLLYDAAVPANTSATLYLPAKSEAGVLDADGCELLQFENGKAVYKLESGSYHFVSTL